MKCIVVDQHNLYLTPRRNNGNMYESRSGWSSDINDAKVFQSQGAAKNSAMQNGTKFKFYIREVTLTIIEPTT